MANVGKYTIHGCYGLDIWPLQYFKIFHQPGDYLERRISLAVHTTTAAETGGALGRERS